MKRVLLLVLLLVSLAELTLERDRIYLLFSTAALAGLVRITLSGRRRPHDAAKLGIPIRNKVNEGASAFFPTRQSDVDYTSHPHSTEDRYEKAEFARESAYVVSDGS